MTGHTDADLLRRLDDLEALRRLKATYFRTLDTKQWDEWGQVFAEDATLEVPEANVVERGREAIVASVSAALAGATTVHHGHTPELEITGPDAATGIWAMCDYVEWSHAASGERVGLQGYGHYHETYVREAGRWRIATSRLERLRVDALGP